ncbi:tetratricopeptide repeat protein [uncultured Thiodictyon sp.]|uniref:tetratricopeptide repeat protein n=1 Tax=uncultured Thiodictyon sp. TaxID=1846217 RepID=UPI0025D2147A|nr:tetratricopeptide repeat protein [uncultured Thiodictyon sp.]
MEPTAAPPTAEPHQELTIGEALSLAISLHEAGHLEPAAEIYQRVLEVAPEHPDALHFLGMLVHAQGDTPEALRLMSRSVELAPNHAGFHNNLGNLMLENERFADADREYRAALALDKNRPDTLHNYAVLLRAFGLYREAERCLLRAIELAPDFTDACITLASLYDQYGRSEDALEHSTEVLKRRPLDARAREIQSMAYLRLGRFEEAAAVFHDWLASEPDNPRALHHLAACTGEGVPVRASDAYVQSVFDAFSHSFDAKLAVLQYRAPTRVGETIAAHLGAAATDLAVLDAGCGTGLCATLLRPFAARLEGIDLSAGMLEHARRRDLYDALYQAELTAFMDTHPKRYDLVVSTDTLIYFGELADAMHAAARTLRPGGHLCFTVEALAPDATTDYQLYHHGRYAHSREYVTTALAQAGLALVKIERESLRHERGEPVAFWLVLAQQPGA